MQSLLPVRPDPLERLQHDMRQQHLLAVQVHAQVAVVVQERRQRAARRPDVSQRRDLWHAGPAQRRTFRQRARSLMGGTVRRYLIRPGPVPLQMTPRHAQSRREFPLRIVRGEPCQRHLNRRRLRWLILMSD